MKKKIKYFVLMVIFFAVLFTLTNVYLLFLGPLKAGIDIDKKAVKKASKLIKKLKLEKDVKIVWGMGSQYQLKDINIVMILYGVKSLNLIFDHLTKNLDKHSKVILRAPLSFNPQVCKTNADILKNFKQEAKILTKSFGTFNLFLFKKPLMVYNFLSGIPGEHPGIPDTDENDRQIPGTRQRPGIFFPGGFCQTGCYCRRLLPGGTGFENRGADADLRPLGGGPGRTAGSRVPGLQELCKWNINRFL